MHAAGTWLHKKKNDEHIKRRPLKARLQDHKCRTETRIMHIEDNLKDGSTRPTLERNAASLSAATPVVCPWRSDTSSPFFLLHVHAKLNRRAGQTLSCQFPRAGVAANLSWLATGLSNLKINKEMSWSPNWPTQQREQRQTHTRLSQWDKKALRLVLLVKGRKIGKIFDNCFFAPCCSEAGKIFN